MDRKSLESIKAPEEWIAAALQPENSKRQPQKRKTMRNLKPVAAAVLLFLLCGTVVTVAATKSTVFRSLLENIFGRENVTEVELESQKDRQTPVVTSGKSKLIELEENMMVVGEKESFISEYHFVGDDTIVDGVYMVESDKLKKMTPVLFESIWDGEKIGFEYVVSGNEIYAFNYTGGISEIFSHYQNGTVYGVRDEIEGKKGYLLEINLEEQTVEKISGDHMICNFVMSPEGTKILCNHRGDGYWSVFDIAGRKETKISTKLLNGYARTQEIEFLDENRILTYGESVFKGNTEIPCTIAVNLQTMQMEKKYPDIGLINLNWSFRYHKKKKILEFYEITENRTITIPDVEKCGYVVAKSSDYVVFGNREEDGGMEEDNGAFYLIRLSTGTWKKIEIPAKLKNDLDIHLVTTQKKILITNNHRAYLVDVSSL